MPPKKRAARTVPQPTIMVQPNLPLDLPTPTTTRNRQPRAQTTLATRTTRQSTWRSEGKPLSSSHTMQRPGSSSARGANEGLLIGMLDTADSQDAGDSQQDLVGSFSQGSGGHTNEVEDSRSASDGPSTSGYLTPLSETYKLPENMDELDGEASGLPESSASHTGALTQERQPSVAASSSSSSRHALVGKRKRAPSELMDDDIHERPASQGSSKKAYKGKGKGKARAASESQNIDENIMSIPQSPAKPHAHPPSQDSPDESPPSSYTNKGKGKARATSAVDDPTVLDISDSPVKPHANEPQPPRDSEPLSAYTCPICFGAPTNATLTPCGHICCGACLFAAVKTTMARAPPSWAAGPGGGGEARCPVCRAIIPHWDGKGRGVVGLQIRTAINI